MKKQSRLKSNKITITRKNAKEEIVRKLYSAYKYHNGKITLFDKIVSTDWIMRKKTSFKLFFDCSVYLDKLLYKVSGRWLNRPIDNYFREILKENYNDLEYLSIGACNQLLLDLEEIENTNKHTYLRKRMLKQTITGIVFFVAVTTITMIV